ncbi:MAG: hypothetical protein OEZ32_14000, partial [Nitrospinota bacterium]|nr:hypothetical protein [Nitrospinota bacterium]
VLAGAVKKQQVSTITVAPGSIPANSVKAVAVTCQGAISGQVTTVNRTSVHTGVGIANAWVSGADQITIEFSNLTGAPVDPGNQQLIIHLI